MKEEELIKEKEVKQNWIIPLIIILIILLVISGTLAYLFYYKNAEKFINQVKNEIVSLNNNILEFKDYKGKDIKYNGNLVVNEVGPFNYSLSLSTKENIFNIDLNYGDDLNKLDGKIIYQDDNLYLNSNLLDKTLHIPTEEKFNIKDLEFLDIDYNYMYKKIVDAYFEGLKEAKLETKINNIKEKTYTIELDEISAKNANEKFEKLLMDDEKLKVLTDMFEMDNISFYPTGKIIVKVNTWTDKLIEYSFTNEFGKISGKYDGEKYTLENDEYNWELYKNKDSIRLYFLYLEKPIVTLKYDYNEKLELSISENNELLDFSLKKVDDNNYEFNINYQNGDNYIKLEGKIKAKDIYNYEITIDGQSNIEGNNINLSSSLNMTYGDNLVSKVALNNVGEVEDLTEEDLLSIMMNLTNILGISEGDF